MEADNDPKMWVNHKCKSGETLYQYNVVTGKRRWLSYINQDQTREEQKTDKISTSTSANCVETMPDSANLVNGQSLSSNSDVNWKIPSQSDTTKSNIVPSQNSEIKMETDSDEEQYSIADVLFSRKRSSHEYLTNSNSCAPVLSENLKAELFHSSETYVIADIAKSINCLAPTMTTESHLTQSKTGKEESQTSFKCPHCRKCFLDSSTLGEHPCFKCRTCHKHLKDSKELADHRRAHLLEEPFKCPKCSPWFKTNLVLFLQVHSGRQEFQCADCKSLYLRPLTPSRVLLEPVTRIRALLLEKQFHCKSCDSWFRKESNLKMFLDVHSGRAEFVCLRCKSTFQRTNNPEGTGLICTFPPYGNLFITPFKCAKCCPWFKVESNLRKFLKIRPMKSQFTCEQCNSVYTRLKTSSGALTNVLVHTTIFHSRKCGMCSKTLNSLSDYNNHCHAHMLERHFKCFTCSVLFTQETYLEKYLKVHSNRNLFVCSECSRAYVRSEKESCLLQPANKPFHCEQCNKSFWAAKLFKDHMEIHSGKVFNCRDCNKFFLSSTALSGHRLYNHPDSSVSAAKKLKEFKCTECGKSFQSSFSLRSHVMAHNKPKVVECKECFRRFTSWSTFTFHTRLHLVYGTGEVFRCKNCKKEFQQVELLHNHSQFHCELNSGHAFECKQCDLSFNNLRKFNNHFRIHRKEFVCQYCGKIFSSAPTFAKHLKEHSIPKSFSIKKRYSCEHCNEEFSRSRALRKHLKVHPRPREKLECEYCHKQYIYHVSYEKHLKRHSKS